MWCLALAMGNGQWAMDIGQSLASGHPFLFIYLHFAHTRTCFHIPHIVHNRALCPACTRCTFNRKHKFHMEREWHEHPPSDPMAICLNWLTIIIWLRFIFHLYAMCQHCFLFVLHVLGVLVNILKIWMWRACMRYIILQPNADCRDHVFLLPSAHIASHTRV